MIILLLVLVISLSKQTLPFQILAITIPIGIHLVDNMNLKRKQVVLKDGALYKNGISINYERNQIQINGIKFL
jgi:hypothetical protein